MKKILFALLLLPAVSQAGVIDMEFSGSVNNINYAKCQGMSMYGSCNSWTHTNLTSSDAYKGVKFELGNKFAGTFSYDADADYVLSSDGYQAVYLDAVLGSTLSIGGIKLPSTAMPVTGRGNLSVVDGRFGTDLLMLQQLFRKDDWFGIMSVFLQDGTGKVYNGFDIPTTFKTTDYHYANMNLTFLQTTTGDQLQISGKLSDFGIPAAEVPEPATASLAMLGVAGLVMSRRRKKAA